MDYKFDTVAVYSYNAWGEILSVTDSSGNEITDESHIANINPIRYRGYYYDTETGFYYCGSRYYNPVFCRWINADGYASTGQGLLGCNMYAYCGNNPVNYIDSDGEFPVAIGAGVATVAAVAALCALAAEAASEVYEDVYRFIAKSKTKSFSKDESKEKDATNTNSNKIQAYFTIDPYKFKPRGLVMTEYPGTRNGRIIEWRDPISHAKIFEWNEDFRHGSHYHAMMIQWDGHHRGTHYQPGTPVPEPWNSIYFGFGG